MDIASQYDNFDVLEWWKNSGLELKFNQNAMNWASKK